MQNIYARYYYKNKCTLPAYLAETIDILLKGLKVSSVLEIGCGEGLLLNFLNSRGYHAYGCDISFYAAKVSGQINADAVHLPIKDKAIDSVIAISLIEHLNLDEGRLFLMEAKRIIKKEGIIFLVTPNKSSLKSLLFGGKWMYDADPSHKYFYTPYSLSSELKKVNFYNIRLQFAFPRNTSLYGWSIPITIQKTKIPWVRDLINWSLVSSPLSLMRNSFWICAQKLR